MKKAVRRILLLIVLIVLAVIYRPGKEGSRDLSLNLNSNDQEQGPNNNNEDDSDNDNSDTVGVNGNDVVGAPNGAELINSPESQAADAKLAANTEGFMEYNASAVQEAVNDGKRVALFFHAPRCPTCRALAKDIQENIADIDDNTIILQVDYDTQVALKQKYGVVSQHTIVYIDENLEAEKISRGIPTLEQLLKNFTS